MACFGFMQQHLLKLLFSIHPILPSAVIRNHLSPPRGVETSRCSRTEYSPGFNLITSGLKVSGSLFNDTRGLTIVTTHPVTWVTGLSVGGLVVIVTGGVETVTGGVAIVTGGVGPDGPFPTIPAAYSPPMSPPTAVITAATPVRIPGSVVQKECGFLSSLMNQSRTLNLV
jgi:hypothetical protein